MQHEFTRIDENGKKRWGHWPVNIKEGEEKEKDENFVTAAQKRMEAIKILLPIADMSDFTEQDKIDFERLRNFAFKTGDKTRAKGAPRAPGERKTGEKHTKTRKSEAIMFDQAFEEVFVPHGFGHTIKEEDLYAKYRWGQKEINKAITAWQKKGHDIGYKNETEIVWNFDVMVAKQFC